MFETWGEFLDIIYTTEDVLLHYRDAPDEIELSGVSRRVEFNAFPFLVRVPEGQELAAAARYPRFPEIAAASPNFDVTPLQPAAVLNDPVVNEAIKFLQARPAANECGVGVRVAVLDTGIDPAPFPPGAVHHLQYDTVRPSLSPPYDHQGHGTAVALIINTVAPGVQLFSVKCIDQLGNLMALTSGMFLAESKFVPNIINLSLGMDCSGEQCENCGWIKETPALSWHAAQIFASFRRHPDTGVDPLLVAGAGNKPGPVQIPAALPHVLAVGAFDPALSDRQDYSRYAQIPDDRFIMAPGGRSKDADCMGQDLTKFKPKKLWGTSFSAAFVSGIAARYMCDRMCGSGCTGSALALSCLAESADRSFTNYRRDYHGLGVARYQQEVGRRIRMTVASHSQTASPFRLPTEAASLVELRKQLMERSYFLWEQTGQTADENWQRARRELGVPEWLNV